MTCRTSHTVVLSSLLLLTVVMHVATASSDADSRSINNSTGSRRLQQAPIWPIDPTIVTTAGDPSLTGAVSADTGSMATMVSDDFSSSSSSNLENPAAAELNSAVLPSSPYPPCAPGSPGCLSNPISPTPSTNIADVPVGAVTAASGNATSGPTTQTPAVPASSPNVGQGPASTSPAAPGDFSNITTAPNVTMSPRPGEAPVKPRDPGQDEILPADLLRQLASAGGQLPAEVLMIKLIVRGVEKSSFDSTFQAPTATTTASLSGTETDNWIMNITQQQQQRAGRRLLQQQQQQLLQVILTIYTYNPQLVWYRLSQAPAAATLSRAAAVAAPSGSVANSTAFTGCTTEYCARLVAAGVPVDVSTIQISPSYDSLLVSASNGGGTSLSALAAQLEANNAAVQQTRRYIGWITGPVFLSIALIILWWQRKRIIAVVVFFWRFIRGQPLRQPQKEESVGGSGMGPQQEIGGSGSESYTTLLELSKSRRVGTASGPSTGRSGSDAGSSATGTAVTGSHVSASASGSGSSAMAAMTPQARPGRLTQWDDDDDDFYDGDTLSAVESYVPDDDVGSMSSLDYAARLRNTGSVISRNSVDSGTVVTIQDFVSDRASMQQRWEQLQRSGELDDTERAVLEKYFGRMQEQAEVMQASRPRASQPSNRPETLVEEGEAAE